MAWILRTGGGDAIAIEGEISIGRDPQCTVRIKSPTVSRVHCRLRAADTHVIVMAEGMNGTLVNGIRIGSVAHVGIGDVIEVDSERWQIQKVDAVPAPAPVYAPAPAPMIATPTSPFASRAPTAYPPSMAPVGYGPEVPTMVKRPVTGSGPGAGENRALDFEVEVVEEAAATPTRYRDAIRLADDHVLVVMTDFMDNLPLLPRSPALIRQWKDAVRSVGSRGKGPDDVLRVLNKELSEAGLQAVGTCARVNLRERLLHIACAGMPPPFVLRTGNRVARVQATPSVELGRLRAARFSEKSLHFDHGDTLLLASTSWLRVLEQLLAQPVALNVRAAQWLRQLPHQPPGGSLLCLSLR